MKTKLMISMVLIGCAVAVSGCDTLTEMVAFDAIPQATFKDKAKPNVVEKAYEGKKFKVTDRIILGYASDVQKFMRRRMSGKRALRKASASIQVMTAAIAAALTAFGGSPVTIASFAGVSAIIPELQGIFQAAGGAEAFRHGAALIGDAETDYLMVISEKNGGQVPELLTPEGAHLYKRVVASIVLVEKALLEQIPSLKEVSAAEIKFERSAAFAAKEVQDRVKLIEISIDALDPPSKALALFKNPPVALVAGTPLANTINAMTQGREVTNPATAQILLKRMVILGDRTNESLEAWETALKPTQ